MHGEEARLQWGVESNNDNRDWEANGFPYQLRFCKKRRVMVLCTTLYTMMHWDLKVRAAIKKASNGSNSIASIICDLRIGLLF